MTFEDRKMNFAKVVQNFKRFLTLYIFFIFSKTNNTH